MEDNQHEDIPALYKLGLMDYQHPATTMAEQMMIIGLIDEQNLKDCSDDFFLNDVYVQLAWSEIHRYMVTAWEYTDDLSCGELEFWKRHQIDFPILSQTSRIVLSQPVASSPLENDFSVAGDIMRPKRNNLSMEYFEMLLFISRMQCQQPLAIRDIIELNKSERETIIEQYIRDWSPMNEVLSHFFND
jgi:hAT family C-terminal dimerisation region